MKLDAILRPDNWTTLPAAAKAAEQLGIDALWTGEARNDPFLPLALAAEHTQHIGLGTGIALAFVRSPTALAYVAWDLATLSRGRFMLGLGTQVKAHIERRFGMKWEAPVARMRETALALRAIWDCWQNGTALDFHGRFFNLTLMTPFFSPPPLANARIPIVIAGVKGLLCELAGEVADGFCIHPFHTAKFVREATLPAIAAGAAKARRRLSDIEVSGHILTATNDLEREQIRTHIAFHASTPYYRPVLECHGWGDLGERMSDFAKRGRWAEMPKQIDDEVLETFAIISTPGQLPERIISKYSGLLDRVIIWQAGSVEPGPKDTLWRSLAEALHAEAETDGVKASRP